MFNDQLYSKYATNLIILINFLYIIKPTIILAPSLINYIGSFLNITYIKHFHLCNNTIQLQHNVFSYTHRMCIDLKEAIIRAFSILARGFHNVGLQFENCLTITKNQIW
jgi:hypothetical protein